VAWSSSCCSERATTAAASSRNLLDALDALYALDALMPVRRGTVPVILLRIPIAMAPLTIAAIA